MPATSMGTVSPAPANPSLGKFVMMSPFSGPKGSPLDRDQVGNTSTGALNTGIGFGANRVIGPVAPGSIRDVGMNDDYTPGITLPNGLAATVSSLVAIGGGRSNLVNGTGPNGNGTPAGTTIAAPVPYTGGFSLVGFGNGGSRDAGAGPAFQGFNTKTVTATGAVANGAAIEAGFLNRSGVAMVAGQSAFGSNVVASGVVA